MGGGAAVHADGGGVEDEPGVVGDGGQGRGVQGDRVEAGVRSEIADDLLGVGQGAVGDGDAVAAAEEGDEGGAGGAAGS